MALGSEMVSTAKTDPGRSGTARIYGAQAFTYQRGPRAVPNQASDGHMFSELKLKQLIDAIAV